MPEQKPIYLDHNATTPLDERAFEAMRPYLFEAFGNAASRTHTYGRFAAQAIERGRAQVAALLNADAKEIIWTSGATESNNLAIKGAVESRDARGGHVITQATEHPAVLDVCRRLESAGTEVTVLPVDSTGRIDPNLLEKAIRPDTFLVSVMWANNETGTLQPVHEIGAICQQRGVIFHTDATQAVGKIPVDVRTSTVDLLSFSAHKFYGPKGCGGLFIRAKSPRIRLGAQLDGGGHERGYRSGTLNVPGIVGAGAAAAIAQDCLAAEASRLSALRTAMEQGLCSRLAGVTINGSVKHRLPHVTNLTFQNVESEALLMALADEIAASNGSACSSTSMAPSHVLTAMGLNEREAFSTVRFSLGRITTPAHVQHAVDRLAHAVAGIRAMTHV
jgi:cysteine desulfurase